MHRYAALQHSSFSHEGHRLSFATGQRTRPAAQTSRIAALGLCRHAVPVADTRARPCVCWVRCSSQTTRLPRMREEIRQWLGKHGLDVPPPRDNMPAIRGICTTFHAHCVWRATQCVFFTRNAHQAPPSPVVLHYHKRVSFCICVCVCVCVCVCE